MLSTFVISGAPSIVPSNTPSKAFIFFRLHSLVRHHVLKRTTVTSHFNGPDFATVCTFKCTFKSIFLGSYLGFCFKYIIYWTLKRTMIFTHTCIITVLEFNYILALSKASTKFWNCTSFSNCKRESLSFRDHLWISSSSKPLKAKHV